MSLMHKLEKTLSKSIATATPATLLLNEVECSNVAGVAVASNLESKNKEGVVCVSWEDVRNIWYDHYFKCQQCQRAGKVLYRTDYCPIGQRLRSIYEDTSKEQPQCKTQGAAKNE